MASLLTHTDGPLVLVAWLLSDSRGSVGGNLQVHGVLTYMHMLPHHLNLSPSRLDSGVNH